MKPFHLNSAKRGQPVQTVEGLEVKIISFEAQINKNGTVYPVIALIKTPKREEVFSFTADGMYSTAGASIHDLVMKLEKRTGWVRVYQVDDELHAHSKIYLSLEEARQGGMGRNIKILKIEYEE